VKSITDQIKDLENTRAAKAARMTDIAAKASEAGRSMDDAEAEEFDTLDGEIKRVDADLVRMRRIESLNVQRAVAVDGSTQKGAVSTKGADAPLVIAKRDHDEKFKGQNYTRMVIARALAHIKGVSPSRIAAARWGKSNPTLVEIIRANEVASAGSDSGEWGAELVAADGRYTGDFIEYLHAATVFDRLPLREVPANVTIKGQDGTATGYWVGQSKAIPATSADFSTVNLTPLKVAALAVISNELLEDSSPAAEALVRDALVKASAQRVDATFLSTTAASSGVSPAGLLNGLTAIGSAGSDINGVISDIKALHAGFISDKNNAELMYVTTPYLAMSLGLMQTDLQQSAFPGLTRAGGSLKGTQMITGDNVGSGDLILLSPSDIWRIGDTGVEVSVSRDATVEMNSVPVGAADVPTASSEDSVSMFQTESTAIKVVRRINFQKRRTGAVAYVGDADYGNSGT
jgi:HK97 family phage major capsid protein